MQWCFKKQSTEEEQVVELVVTDEAKDQNNTKSPETVRGTTDWSPYILCWIDIVEIFVRGLALLAR
jgi:hypothetical protein